MRQAVKDILRPPLSRLAGIHRPGPLPDIAVVSSPRSGSTWLMEMIASQPGLKYINECDHKEQLARHRALQIEPRWRWLSLTARERSDLAHFLLDDRRSGLFGPAKPFEKYHSVVTYRRVLKLIRMTALVEWLVSIGFVTVYVLRHPIPQARSSLARGHRILLREFLADAEFLRRLDGDAVAYARKVADGKDPLLAFVTQWCLENAVALQSPAAGRDFAVTSHECRIEDPMGETGRLAAILRLQDVQLLPGVLERPSRTTDSSSAETRDDIRTGRRSRLLEGWRRELTDAEEARLMEPLRAFGIDVYRRGEIMPNLPEEWTTSRAPLDGPIMPAPREET